MVSISSGEGMRLICFDSIEEGKQLLFKFDFGTIDDPVFGKSEKLHGELELFYSNGSYPITSYFHLTKDEQENLLETKMTTFRQLFHYMSEEDLREWLNVLLIMTALCCPRIEVTSKRFKILSDTLTMGFLFDDLLEEHPGFGNIGFFYQTMTKDGHDIPGSMMTKPKRELFFNRLTKFVDGIENVPRATENYFEDVDSEELVGMKEWIKMTMYGIETFVIRQAIVRNNLPITEEVSNYIRPFEAGLGVIIEAYSSARKCIIPKHIRKTILFQLFVKGVIEFGSQINDVIGLLKDLKIKVNPPNQILRRVIQEGITIDESFQQALNLWKGTVQNMKVIGNLLLEAFPNDINLAGYIESSFDLCDGQVVAYLVGSQLKSRYGSIKMELVGI